MSASQTANSDSPPAKAGEYIVVARRYRPQTFADLIGQEHVAQALAGAISSERVGHAYLFTGARGVGKTSSARILAKALNCVHGPTPTPCNECDICRSISSGDDVDVLEIDGASNRGIDEMRELRQNVNVRPSRARFKIYIIDEVHMLTKEAFNALLKTLEEPPEHVKFIFCTTEPEKIPITILSRCQRFDFAGIQTPSIAARLAQIVAAEGVTAEPEALEALARRAAGSMRDSQSLLEQLLAFGGQQITLADVHRMLGTAGDKRLGQLARHLAARDAAAALGELDAAVAEGVDIGPLLDQLLGYFRDMMAAAVGCPAESLLYASPSEQPAMLEAGRQLGLETILAVMQILDQTIARLRYSTHGRILAELAVVRICSLENLERLSGLIGRLRDGLPPPARVNQAPGPSLAPPEPAKKKWLNGEKPTDPAATMPAELPREKLLAGPETAARIWSETLTRLTGMLADHAREGKCVATSAPNRLAIHFPAAYTFSKSFCEKPEHLSKLERTLAEVAGQPLRLEFVLEDAAPGAETKAAAVVRRAASPSERLMEKAENPLVRRAMELFAARPVRVDEPEPKATS
ncbi:MAG TPA: DNA polymerase III subunit gamma/tau [Pirellulales bacterium]|nr:DNA polymerase III subunit gamma/tau [Pirellulales bacterium]